MFWNGLAAAALALACWQNGDLFRAGLCAGIGLTLLLQSIDSALEAVKEPSP